MISAWWLIPTCLTSFVAGFFTYERFAVPMMGRWDREDKESRQRALLSLAPEKLQQQWPDLTDAELRAFQQLDGLTGPEFERLIGRLYQTLGYQVNHVGGSGDHGIDLFATSSQERVVIQCKRWGILTPVSNGDLRNFLGAIQPHEPCRAVFITTSRLTGKAGDFVDMSKIEVLTGRDTVRLLLEHGLLDSSSRGTGEAR